MSGVGVLFNQVTQLEVYCHGRSKAYLTVITCFFSTFTSFAFAQDTLLEQAEPTRVELVMVGKMILPLAIAILANAAIPAFKYYYNQFTLKKSYLIYIRANVRSTLINYGATKSIESIVHEKFAGHRPYWMDMLEEAELEVPMLLYCIHLAFDRASEEQGDAEGYIPYVSYAGMPIPSDLDHEHPIWAMKKANTRHIADFLLSQAQVEKSIAQHYVEPIFHLAKSTNKNRRQQWIDGGYLIVGELAQHYINTMRLKTHLS